MGRKRSYGWPGAAVSLLLAALLLSATTAEDHVHRESVGFGELEEEWRGEVVHLSWRPRAFLYKKFLSDVECDHIIRLAKPSMEASDVVNNDTGESEFSNVRTSTGTFLDPAQDHVITVIEKRVAQVTMTPRENQESMQVLRYVKGQKYESHHDFFYDDKNKAPEVGGQRLVTALMYLSTPEEGGETVFPESTTPSLAPPEQLSPCALKGLANKPQKGDLIIFYSLHPDGTEDETSLHESCPVIKGEKWSATIWIHTGMYQDRTEEGEVIPRQLQELQDPCHNENEMCDEWAFFGECDKNPAYMLVGCKAACKVCQPGHVSAPSPLTEDEKRNLQQQN